MCGIAGKFNFKLSEPVDKEELSRVIKRIDHRGPDDEGFYLHQNIGLAHKRLSIIDIEGGHQPMLSEDGKVVLVFNGEIYNYIELKKQLLDLGYRFTSNSDTEVILKAYTEWGDQCVVHFNGMWSFAILDLRKSTPQLFCSRDRFGIKPFYYSADKNKFQFASELKAFNGFNNFKSGLNKPMLWDALVYGPKSKGETILEDVIELGPGENLFVSSDGVYTETYFDLASTFDNQRKKYDLAEIEWLLMDAVHLRLRSDVPVATINSGGLDSSLLSSLASRVISSLNTYSVTPEPDVNGKPQAGDESHYAGIISRYLSTQHHTVRYSLEQFEDNLSNAVHYNDGFLFHSNSVPLHILFEKIKSDGITVVLGGEGADEIFRGYYSNQILSLQNLSGRLLGKLILNRKYKNRAYLFSFDKDINRIIPYIRNSTFSPEHADSILNIHGEVCRDRQNQLDKMVGLSPENGLAFFEQSSYLAGLLKRADRMAMMHSVELRVPYLDHRIAQYLNSITHEAKCGKLIYREKKILKAIGSKYLPASVTRRKKYGFASPVISMRDQLIDRLNSFNFSHEEMSDKELWLLCSLIPDSILNEMSNPIPIH